MFTDTHAHLYLDNYRNDINNVIIRAKNQNVKQIIIPNIDENSRAEMFSLCSEYPDVLFPALGLHPTSVKENYELQIQQVFSNIPETVCAIGETGIDLYWDKSLFKQQKEAFAMQLQIAIDNNLPVIIHSRESMKEILDILDSFNNSDIRGVFHCYSGNYAQALQLVSKGFYIGIGGVVTYKNNNLVEIVRKIPLEYLLLETDSPFLPPVPFRGKRNEPAFIYCIAAKISKIKGIDIKTVGKQTSLNTQKCFGIRPAE